MSHGHDDSTPLDFLDREVYQRQTLALDPMGTIAIKRDVRRIDVGAPAPEVARAFHQVLSKAGNRFGLIEILRTAEKTGRPYELGERFQGRFGIERALLEEVRDSFLRALSPTLARLIDVLQIDELLEAIANRVASDYGVITELDLEPDAGRPIRLRYEYLEGTPLAGSSTFMVEPLGDDRCRCSQVFEYQEQGTEIVLFMGTAGLSMHNEVVYREVEQAADLLGAPVLSSDIELLQCESEVRVRISRAPDGARAREIRQNGGLLTHHGCRSLFPFLTKRATRWLVSNARSRARRSRRSPSRTG